MKNFSIMELQIHSTILQKANVSQLCGFACKRPAFCGLWGERKTCGTSPLSDQSDLSDLSDKVPHHNASVPIRVYRA
jgi:hypothetical protein